MRFPAASSECNPRHGVPRVATPTFILDIPMITDEQQQFPSGNALPAEFAEEQVEGAE